MTCMCCQKLKIKNNLIREAFSEFLGTFTLVLLGLATNAVYILSRGTGMGSPVLLSIGWGIAVAGGVYVAGGASGAHVNPAVTTSFALCRIFPWKKVPVYILAQYLGAFAACPLVYLVYLDSMNHIDGGIRQTSGINATAGIFSTFPIPQVSNLTAFADQTIAVAMLLILVLAIIDENNMKPHRGLLPLSIGFVIIMFSCAFGMNCGCPLNPARDLSPRLFTAIAGWGLEPFSFRDYKWFWVPIVAPHVGGAIGTIIYVGLIRHHWTFMPESIESIVSGEDIKKKLEVAGIYYSKLGCMYSPDQHIQTTAGVDKASRITQERKF